MMPSNSAAVGYVATVVGSPVAPDTSAALTAVSVTFAYCAAMLRISSSMKSGDERSNSSTLNVCCPEYLATDTLRNSDV